MLNSARRFRIHLTPEARRTTTTVHGVSQLYWELLWILKKIGASQITTTTPGPEAFWSSDTCFKRHDCTSVCFFFFAYKIDMCVTQSTRFYSINQPIHYASTLVFLHVRHNCKRPNRRPAPHMQPAHKQTIHIRMLGQATRGKPHSPPVLNAGTGQE